MTQINFAAFLMHEPYQIGTDFTQWMKVLNFLGAVPEIVHQLHDYSKNATDEIGMLTAWKLFGHIFINTGIVKVIPENVDFLFAHEKYDLMLPSETFSIPTCLPEKLLEFIDPSVAVFFGTALIPRAKFVRSNQIHIYLLRCNRRISILQDMIQVLIDCNYVIISKGLNTWECVPPTNENRNNIVVGAVYETCWTDVIKNSQFVGHGFFLDTKSSACISVSLKHDMMHGGYYDNYLHSLRMWLSGYPMHVENKKEFESHNEWPIPDEMQSKCKYDCLMQFHGLSYLDNRNQFKHQQGFEVLKTKKDILMEENYNFAFSSFIFYDTCYINNSIGVITNNYHFALRGKFMLKSWISKNSIHRKDVYYKLIALDTNNNYSRLCELLSKELNITLISNVAYISDIKDTKWWICEIIGFENNVLMWNCI
jgi:hypothetical protein